MKNYMFTETQNVEFFKPKPMWFLISALMSVVYHLKLETTISQLIGQTLQINPGPLALTIAIYTGATAILFSLLFKCYGQEKIEQDTITFARKSLSIGFGGVFGWMCIAAPSSNSAISIPLAIASFATLVSLFWVLPNMMHHGLRKLQHHHMDIRLPTLLAAVLMMVLSISDVMSSPFI